MSDSITVDELEEQLRPLINKVNELREELEARLDEAEKIAEEGAA